MKQKILLMLLTLLLALPMMARDFEYTYEGQTITYTVVDEKAKTCKTKDGNWGNSGNVADGDLTLPSNPKDEDDVEFTLISIGDYGFCDCSSMTSVVIPNSIAGIGNMAFFNCNSLTKAGFPSIESLCSINFGDFESNPLFLAHHLYIDGKEVTELIIPETITSIKENVFAGCSALTSVKIPNSITEILRYAFYNCSGLTYVNIPNSVTYIGEGAFAQCNSLMKAEYASIESLCNIYFGDPNANPLCYAQNLYINGKEITELEISETVTSIGQYAFCGCRNLTNVKIPNSVTKIGEAAFQHCSSLSSIVIPNSIVEIDNSVFYRCSSLISVVIPNSTTKIGKEAFYSCNSLTSIELPNSVTEIGSKAFGECSSLTSIEIPNSVTKIGDYAFSSCSSLTSIGIPDSIIEIESGAFYGCSGLISVIIPNSITEICPRTFFNCTSLTSVVIPDSVLKIGYSAFLGCISMTSVEIPDSITEIGGWTFYGCDNLKSVICRSENPVSNITYDAFPEEAYENSTLYVPKGCIEAYKIAEVWSNFLNISDELYNGVDIIEENAIIIDYSKPYEVYNLNGMKIGEAMEGLAKGIYVVRQGSQAVKVSVK